MWKKQFLKNKSSRSLKKWNKKKQNSEKSCYSTKQRGEKGRFRYSNSRIKKRLHTYLAGFYKVSIYLPSSLCVNFGLLSIFSETSLKSQFNRIRFVHVFLTLQSSDHVTCGWDFFPLNGRSNGNIIILGKENSLFDILIFDLLPVSFTEN